MSASFLTASLGGLIIGFLVGIFTALVCKWTKKDCSLLKPMFVLVNALLAYGLAQQVGFSPVISLITYGIRKGLLKTNDIQWNSTGQTTCL